MNKRIFMKNTALMTGTSLLLRTLGIVFRIFISNRVGAEGMGLYQLVFSIYVLGSTFAAAGIITAVTRMVGEQLIRQDTRAVHRVMRLSVGICLLVGLVSALLLYGLAESLGRLMGDVRTVPALRLSGLALPFIGVSSCIKGYFAARRRAGPPSLSQILEQLTRIGGILLMLRLAGEGCSLSTACCIIIVGDALSEALSCGVLTVVYRRDIRHHCPRRKPGQATVPRRILAKELMLIALPLTAGRYLTTALRTAENILVPARLTLFTHSDALSLEQFGAVKGMALPLIFFPSAFLMTISSLLIPELSDAHALGQRRQVASLVERTLHVTLIGAMLIGCFFTVLGRELGEYLYHDATVGLFLQILGPLTPIMYVDSIATGMLKGLGEQVSSLWYSVADSAVRIGLILWLLPRYGITGFLLVMVVSNLLTACLSTHRLLETSGSLLRPYRWFFGPLLIALIVGGSWATLRQYVHLTGLPALLAGGGCIILLYCLFLPVFGCFGREDVAFFSKVTQ